MHRKIPKSNKHKKIKSVDPFCRDGRRRLFDKKAEMANQKPVDDEIQEIPRKLKDLMKSIDKEKKKQKKMREIRKPAKGPHEFGVSVDDSDMDEGDDPEEKKVPVLKRLPGESVNAFMKRMHSTVRTIVYESKMEIEREQSENREGEGEESETNRFSDDDDDEDDGIKESKKASKYKKKKQRPLKSTTKQEKRKKYLKEKIVRKKKIAEERIGSLERTQDSVAFGEVVHNPPVISAKLRKCGNSSSDRRPGTKELLLRKMLTTTGVDPKTKSLRLPTATSDKAIGRKSLTAGEQRILDSEREKAIAAYKILKSRRREIERGKKLPVF